VSTIQRVILAIAMILEAAAVLGLLRRGRWHSCLSFSLYLTAVFASDFLQLFWPDRFYTLEFWVLSEVVHHALKFGVAIELAFRAFHAFPGAQSTARRVVFPLVVLTYATVLAVPAHQTAGFGILVGQILPRVLNGTIWLFTSIGALILWYRLPVDRLHKSILLGFVPYLLVFTTMLSLLGAQGWEIKEYTNYVQTVAYVGLLLFWNRAAWQRQRPQQGHSEVELTLSTERQT
jgi:hypothetical protein